MVSGEKRNCEEENGLEKITTILLDIEGTTTSLSFVKDILFPYVRENLRTYVNDHWNDDEFQSDLKALKCQAEKDAEDGVENFSPIEDGEKEKESLIKNVVWQMDIDRKTRALKQLQGHMWREGYESGKLKGHVFEEVGEVLKKWREDGRKLYIYSSGSVEAQKLLFKNSQNGDLSEHLSGYFDTEVGPKTEASSYTNIANVVGCDPNEILFLTDVIKEAAAAEEAGLKVLVVVREGNAPLVEEGGRKGFEKVGSLRDVVFESCSKRKKMWEEDGEGGRKSSERSENVEEMEESNDVENGDAEKMEAEITESTEGTENGESQKAEETKTEEEKKQETESEVGEGEGKLELEKSDERREEEKMSEPEEKGEEPVVEEESKGEGKEEKKSLNGFGSGENNVKNGGRGEEKNNESNESEMDLGKGVGGGERENGEGEGEGEGRGEAMEAVGAKKVGGGESEGEGAVEVAVEVAA